MSSHPILSIAISGFKNPCIETKWSSPDGKMKRGSMTNFHGGGVVE